MGELVLVRNSELSSFRGCRWAWWQNYVEELQPKIPGPPLRFGNLVHSALEAYYIPGRKRGPHPTSTFTALYTEQLETYPRFSMYDDDDERMDAGELGRLMLNHYTEVYGSDDNVEVISPEIPFRVDVPHPKTGKYFCTAVGKLDIVYRDLRTGHIGLMDHKTAKSISTAHLFIDDQAGQYWAFAPIFLREKGLIGSKDNLDHILYNYLRKAPPDIREKNEDGLFINKGNREVSKRQPPPFFHREKIWRGPIDRESFVARMIQTTWEMQQVKKGKLPLYKTPSHLCPRCPFKGPCELHETGSDWEELLRLEFRHWDPYADHEVARKG